ncbi:MAG: hypothetical protein CM15mP74_22620 [Halieaceae bacterium]|nr:MAG: hypothetical protein CM15mP74_22620 [Halieaceae bacterium]
MPYDWIIKNGYRGSGQAVAVGGADAISGVGKNFQPPPGDSKRLGNSNPKQVSPTAKAPEEFRENFQLSYVAEKQIALLGIANAIRAKIQKVGIPVG